MEVAILLGAVAAGVAILAAVVGVTRYFTQRDLTPRREQLEEQLEGERQRYANLVETVADFGRTGSTALQQKTEIDSQLESAMDMLRATDSSILVPEPLRRPSKLVCLSAFGDKPAEAKKITVPFGKGVAGYVFRYGKSTISNDLKTDKMHDKVVDTALKHETHNMLCVALRHAGEIIGVTEFMNKTGGFDENDQLIAERFASSMSQRIAEFTRNHENFQLSGIAREREAREATIMYFDLTASSVLFERLNMPRVIDLINDYFERQCEIAFRYGATVDKFLGDGAMLRFNVPRVVENHLVKAVEAALEMRADFEELKERWILYELPVDGIYSRIAISSGQVYEVIMGHPQYRETTVLGDPTYAAHRLCEIADRTRNIIVIDDNIYDNLMGQLAINALPLNDTTKPVAYELLGIKNRSSASGAR